MTEIRDSLLRRNDCPHDRQRFDGARWTCDRCGDQSDGTSLVAALDVPKYRADIRIRLEIGLLAVLIALCGLGLFDWASVLLGWGLTETAFAARDGFKTEDDW